MSARVNSETKQVRYLQGLSTPAEREHIESEYFHDEDAFQRMMAAEDDLIDAYARGELTGEERRRFEKYFLKSFRGRDRVQFACAFAGVVADVRPVETTSRGSVNVFRVFQGWRGALRLATVATVVVLVAVVSWLVTDRRRINNELRSLRAESAELRKQTQAPPLSPPAENSKPVQTATENRRRASNKTNPKPKNPREKIEDLVSIRSEEIVNTQDASLGNNFMKQKITMLPLDARNVENLLTLRVGPVRHEYIPVSREDQAGVTLHGIDVNENIIRFPSSLPWIRFFIQLETPSHHTDYRLTLKIASAQVAELEWIEPVPPDGSIETPAIHTANLPSGNYVLLLTAKQPDGSYVRVAEYAFKLIRP